jgi:SIR2-like domain
MVESPGRRQAPGFATRTFIEVAGMPDHSSPSWPPALLSSFEQRTLVPFVGAGVSMSVMDRNKDPLFPSWGKLLEKAADRLDANGRQRAAMLVRAFLAQQPPEYLPAAERAKNGLGGAEWSNLLRATLDPDPDSVDDGSLELPQRIWELGCRLIVTSNLDRVLIWACPEKLRRSLRVWGTEHVAGHLEIQQGPITRPTVWHFHGHVDQLDTVILTPDGYSLLYPDGKGRGQGKKTYKSALRALQHLIGAKSLLFIGFSFSDVAIKAQMRWVRDLLVGLGGPHFILIRSAELQAGLEQELIASNIFPITFGDFHELPQLLRDLGVAVAAPDDEGADENGAGTPPPEVQPVSTSPPSTNGTDGHAERIVTIELHLSQPTSEFQPDQLLDELEKLMEPRHIRIARIKSGSTLVNLRGPENELRRLVEELGRASPETREFGRSTALLKARITYEDGRKQVVMYSPAWQLRRLRSDALVQLLKDLQEREETGLRADEAERLAKTLEEIIALSRMPGEGEDEQVGTVVELYRMKSLFLEWTEQSTSEDRRRLLRQMRVRRARYARKNRRAAGADAIGQQPADEMIIALASLVGSYPGTFRNLGRAIRRILRAQASAETSFHHLRESAQEEAPAELVVA